MPRSVDGSGLNAVNLKAVLWDTLRKVKAGRISPAAGDVVASQAREILRTARTQLLIFSQSGESVAEELIDFAKPGQRRSRPAR